MTQTTAVTKQATLTTMDMTVSQSIDTIMHSVVMTQTMAVTEQATLTKMGATVSQSINTTTHSTISSIGGVTQAHVEKATQEVIPNLKSLLEEMWEAIRSESTTRNEEIQKLKTELSGLTTSVEAQNRSDVLGELTINLQVCHSI